MRVYEFSKQHGVSTKEILEALQQGGFGVQSHMAALTQESVDFLNKKFQRASQDTPAAKNTAVPERIEQPKREQTVALQEQVSPSKKIQQPAASTEKQPEEKTTHSAFIQKTPSAPNFTERQGARGSDFSKEAVPESIPLVSMTVAQVAEKLNKPITDVILALLKSGTMASKNQVLSEKIVAQLAHSYNVKPIRPAATVSTEPLAEKKSDTSSLSGKNVQERPPVVVVIGHVDHGKTTLLDYIRKTRVAQKEKGGITQHLGAYEATTSQGKIIFLDTPGHEAFSKMRMRGVKAADIAILVVAADDGVMPQTVEAIKHARSIEIPIIVAANKVDKVDVGRLEAVKRDLARYDLLPEEWGGQTVMVPISAKNGTGIEQLLEMIMLQAQLMELKADTEMAARGYVLESKLEKGRGPVATFLAQHGTLKIGDYFVCGATYGRVSSLVDSYGNRLKEVDPSIPVQVAGFSSLPAAGDFFEVVSLAEQQQRIRQMSEGIVATQANRSSEGVINLLVKTDTNSSKEALIGAIEKLSKAAEKGFNIVAASIGSVSESDVMLAANTGSTIWGLHTKVEPNAQLLAQKQGVKITLHGIIYKLLEDLEQVALGAREIKMIRTKIGEALVRKVFDIKGLGVIAGSYVKDGRFAREGSVVIFRGNKKVGEGKIKSLQRDKKVVKEVHSGFECGFLIDGFDEWQIDDRVECYIDVPEVPKK